ncbi:MAG: response regulator [Pseudomonadota bacterium]
MKILIIDRDEVTSNLIKSRFLPLGHTVEIQAGRGENFDAVLAQGWDMIFFDPSPLQIVKTTLMSMRRAVRRSVYMVLISESLTLVDALAAGFNGFLHKPTNTEDVMATLDCAERLNGIQRVLASTDEDFPSAGGVIAKSAFNQLFLSCLDRADRYGETANVIFISFDNYLTVATNDGTYDAEMVSAKLAQKLVGMRRQSDIIAQIRKNEYALLLLRPMTDAEPIDAAHRFLESLAKCNDLPTNPIMDVNIRVSLMAMPSGHTPVDHTVTLRQQ